MDLDGATSDNAEGSPPFTSQRLVDDRRSKEQEADVNMRQRFVRVCAPTAVLKQAVQLYTPEVYALFEDQYKNGIDLVYERWTREAAKFVLLYTATPPSNVTDSKKIRAQRYSKLLSNFVKLSTIAATDLQAYEIVENICMKANQQINEFLKNRQSTEQLPENVQIVDTVGTSSIVHMNAEPPSSNLPPLEMHEPSSEVIIGMRRREEKGRRRRRYKSSLEKNTRKRRRNEPIGNSANFNATTSEMYNAPHVSSAISSTHCVSQQNPLPYNQQMLQLIR
ncbi:hypothetical protein Taro_049626, partial [Colocasia esculenta]|nr:hypothetical protein [Colocasia esculenta]